MEFSMFRIGCAFGVCLVIMLGTYNVIFAPVADENPPPEEKPFPATDRPPVQKSSPASVEPDVVGFPSDFGYVEKPPVSIPAPKNPNNKPPKNHLPKKKWLEEDFSKKSYDDVTPGYDPLADVDSFVWDGTKKPEKSVDDEYIYPRVFDPSRNWDGTKEPKKKDDKRPPPLHTKIEPEGFVPPVWNNPKKVDDGKYDPNWDRPRFVEEEEKTRFAFDDDDDYLPAFDDDYKPPVKKNPKKVGKGSFDRPGFSAGRNQAPVKNDLAPEWDDEDYYAPKCSNKKKERTSFQAIEW